MNNQDEKAVSAREALRPDAPDSAALLARSVDELVASGLAQTALHAGVQAPAFTLRDGQGRRVTSAGLLEKGPLVMMFYRGSWCTYCQLELAAMECALPALIASGARVVAVSPELPAARTDRVLEMLSDPHNRVAALFGLAYKLPNYVTDLFKDWGNDLPTINGDDSWTLPMVARFVIAPDRTVLYSQVDADYRVRAAPDNVLPVLTAYRQRHHG